MSTLEDRINLLAQAIGADVKTLTSAIASLGGGAVVNTNIISAPYDSKFSYITTILDVGISPTSKIMACFGSTSGTSENDIEDLSDLTLTVNPIDGGLEVVITCPGAFGGPIPINYIIG